jgi:hypothetical protein
MSPTLIHLVYVAARHSERTADGKPRGRRVRTTRRSAIHRPDGR